MCNASLLFIFRNVVSGVTSLCCCQTSVQSEGGDGLYKRHILHITGELHRCNTRKNSGKMKTGVETNESPRCVLSRGSAGKDEPSSNTHTHTQKKAFLVKSASSATFSLSCLRMFGA